MKTFNKISQALLIICIVFPSFVVAERLSKEKEENLPVEITAEMMISYQKSNKIVFTGDVIAKRGDLNIFSDKMTVFNSKKGKEVIKIVAQGNVKIKKGERFASGDRAVYIKKEGTLVLTGNPHAWEKENKIVAVEMIFLLDEDKFIVKGSKEKKIWLKFYPEQKKRGKK